MSRKQKKHLYQIAASASLFCVGLMLSAFFAHNALINTLALAILIAAYLIVGFEVLRNAFSGIRNGQVFDENFLMAIATVGAVLIGE